MIVGYARTAFVRYTGLFADVPATRLGGHALRAALLRSGTEPGAVERVFGGQVLQGGAGQNPARQTAVAAGIPLTVPSITLNAVCLSGMEAVAQAISLIEAGHADIVAAVGQESMSLAPHVWPGSRTGRRYGAVELLDTLEHDGLTDAFEHRSMGASTEDHNRDLGITREDQDSWAAASHQRLAASAEVQATEIEPYVLTSRRGDQRVDQDDGLRPGTTVESLARLRPAFGDDGTITAGTSSQITDGAAALVLMSEAAADRRGTRPLAYVRAHGLVSGPDVGLQAQPANAITDALRQTSWGPGDLGAVEINEAFAAVAVYSTRRLGLDPRLVNAHGGAIALGHPIGASGARIVGHLARRLVALGPGTVGAAGICGGGGQGAALVLEAV
nr:acetyl-CoA C-acyltransferase [Microlunatus antarcticus]